MAGAGLRDVEPGAVFELRGCRARGVRREGGRFFEMSADEREARVEELIGASQKLAGRINADQAALTANTTELLGLFQADHGWGWGWRSPAHRLACQFQLTGAEARRLVATADCLPELPLLSAAFEHGEVSLPVAAALAEVATPDTEAELVEQSRHATADAMLGLVSTFKRIERDNGDRPARTESLTLRAKADGFEVRGFLNASNGALAGKMLGQRCAELFDKTGNVASSAEALMSLFEVGPKPAASRFLAILQIDVEVFRARRERRDHNNHGREDGGCRTGDDRTGDDRTGDDRTGDGLTGVSILHGPPVTDAELDAMHGELSACWMVSRDGHPLWISSKQRTAPPWMRTAMAVEQRCCAAAGCGRAGVLEAHHSVPFTTKPETLFDEQVFLCPFHHRALHANGATVEFADDREKILIRDYHGRVVTLTGVPVPPDVSSAQRPDWAGRGTWTAGMGSYDAYGTDVMLAHLQSGAERWKNKVARQTAGPGEPPPTDSDPGETDNACSNGGGSGHGPPPTSGGHPADNNVTGGDNGGTSPPQD